MKTRTLKVKIVVDENTIEDKYPNYHLNYSDTEEFMDGIQTEIDGISHSDNPLDEWGYDVVVDSNNGTHHKQNVIDKLELRQDEIIKILTNNDDEHLDLLEEFVDITKTIKGW